MAGDVTVAVVSGVQSNSVDGSTDYTKTGFGTPKACLVILTADSIDNASVDPNSIASIGFSDFTNHHSISHEDEDGSAKVDCDALKSANYVMTKMFPNLAFDTRLATASAITNGVRLTNDGAGFGDLVTVIMFGGADLNVALTREAINSSQDGTATRAFSNFTDGNDKLIFFVGTDIGAEDSANSGINNSFGVCHVTGDDSGGYTFTQGDIGWASDHNNNDGSAALVISDDRCLDILAEDGDQDWSLEVTAFSSASGNFTVTTRDTGSGAGMEVYSLALDLDNRKGKVGFLSAPSSGSTWAVTGVGFKPQYVGLGLTRVNNGYGSIEINQSAAVVGISSVTGSGEETCHEWFNVDGAATTDTANLFRSRAIDHRKETGATVLQDHQFSSFDTDGWTYTINTVDSLLNRWFYWAVQDVAGGAPAGQPIARRWGGVPGLGRGGRIGRSW